MSQRIYHGSCLCGKIRFEISGKIENIVCCHCSQCRKVQGTAFATNGNVDAADFHFISGEKEMTAYQFSDEQTKYFCKHCGSPIFAKNRSTPDKVRIRLGTIEDDIEERPAAHIFVGSKANWETIGNDLPQYEEFEPGRQQQQSSSRK